MLQWFTTGAAVLLALAALLRARALSKKLERLAESYWELRYEHGQLRSRIAQFEQPEAVQPVQAPAGGVAFVPLSSLKK